MAVLPIVDIKSHPTAESLALRLLEVGRDPGFFYLVGHDISSKVVASMFTSSKHFFDTISDDEKSRFASMSGEPVRYRSSPFPDVYSQDTSMSGDSDTKRYNFEGYSGPRQEKLSGLGHGDLKESYHFKTFTLFPDTGLPTALDVSRPLLKDFSSQCEGLGRTLLDAFSIGLGLPRNLLTEHHTGEQNRFRMLHYPPFSKPEQLEAPGSASRDVEEDIRAGAHSDYGSLTLLFQEPTDQGGLQVWRDTAWHNVPYIENAIVVNIGDALEFWTAGRLRSTIHRVTFPHDAEETQEVQSRYSIPFFITPDDNTVLKPIIPTSEKSENAREGVDETGGFFGDLARVKGFLSLRPITAREHRIRREGTISKA